MNKELEKILEPILNTYIIEILKSTLYKDYVIKVKGSDKNE